MSKSIQTQEQKRAKSALAWIQDRAKEKDDLQKELKSWASQFPLMVHTNGIGQACAFFKSRNNVAGARLLYAHLNDWLSTEMKSHYQGKKDLMEVIVNCNQQEYRLLQAESLAYLQWIKQLSKAYLKGEVTDKGDA
ncbi:MAG: type III-B CRISPR module-associated protein Cmr5 [Proteobacteria bacterium]|nr:type III-B CRISPR module-associated protein Cmr5 [Pseudomonadota bacterium]